MAKWRLWPWFCDDALHLSSSSRGLFYFLFFFAPHTFKGAERLCYFLLIHTQKPLAHMHRRRAHVHISKWPRSVSRTRFLRKFGPPTWSYWVTSKASYRAVATQHCHSSWLHASLAVAFPSKQSKLLSPVSADWINTNWHGFGIALIFFSLPKMKILKQFLNFTKGSEDIRTCFYLMILISWRFWASESLTSQLDCPVFQPLDLCSRALIISEEMILHESKHHSLKVGLK